MIAAGTYTMSSHVPVLRHASGDIYYVRDDLSEQRQQTDAKVRSGDYFMDLATELDHIVQNVTDPADEVALQRRVSELLYMQLTYKLAKRP